MLLWAIPISQVRLSFHPLEKSGISPLHGLIQYAHRIHVCHSLGNWFRSMTGVGRARIKNWDLHGPDKIEVRMSGIQLDPVLGWAPQLKIFPSLKLKSTDMMSHMEKLTLWNFGLDMLVHGFNPSTLRVWSHPGLYSKFQANWGIYRETLSQNTKFILYIKLLTISYKIILSLWIEGIDEV